MKGLVNDITVRDFDFSIIGPFPRSSHVVQNHTCSFLKKTNWDYEAFLAWEKVKTVNCSFT